MNNNNICTARDVFDLFGKRKDTCNKRLFDNRIKMRINPNIQKYINHTLKTMIDYMSAFISYRVEDITDLKDRFVITYKFSGYKDFVEYGVFDIGAINNTLTSQSDLSDMCAKIVALSIDNGIDRHIYDLELELDDSDSYRDINFDITYYLLDTSKIDLSHKLYCYERDMICKLDNICWDNHAIREFIREDMTSIFPETDFEY